MPWVKLSDDWYDDPLIVEAGDDGGWLWVVALSWCARNLTDGFIPKRQLARLTTLDDPYSVAGSLVALGLFRQDEGGWWVANYHKYQPTRADVLAKRESDSARKRKGVRSDSVRNPDGIADVSARPGPVPVPNPISLSSQSESLPDGGSVDNRVMDEIAKLRLAAQSGVRSRKAWLAKCRENLPAEVGDRVAEVVAAYDEPPRTLAEIVEGKRSNPIGLKRREQAS